MTTASITGPLWDYEYLPFTMSDPEDLSTDTEIPNYRIFPCDSPEDYIAETNERLPGDTQESHARLLSAAPDLYDALEYFFNIMHDYECSVRKGYVAFALERARSVLKRAKEGAI